MINIENIKEEIRNGKMIPLTSDVVFKAVFLRNENVLIKLIKDIFDILEIDKPFTIIGFETLSYKKDGKTYRGDILIKLSDYSYVLVEMNHQTDPDVIDRNMVNLTRIHSQMLERGEGDSELKKYRLRGINFNNFRNKTGNPVEKYAICNIDTGKIVTLMYSFCNIDLVKCRNLVYDISVRNLPNSVRWGAIMMENDIEKISEIIGEDMLSMEEKEKFINTIREVNDDERLLDDWVLEANARMKFKSQINYAKEEARREGMEKGIAEGIVEGREEGLIIGAEKRSVQLIENMLIEGSDYEFISKVTNKTIDEIKEIESNLTNKG